MPVGGFLTVITPKERILPHMFVTLSGIGPWSCPHSTIGLQQMLTDSMLISCLMDILAYMCVCCIVAMSSLLQCSFSPSVFCLMRGCQIEFHGQTILGKAEFSKVKV